MIGGHCREENAPHAPQAPRSATGYGPTNNLTATPEVCVEPFGTVMVSGSFPAGMSNGSCTFTWHCSDDTSAAPRTVTGKFPAVMVAEVTLEIVVPAGIASPLMVQPA